MNEDSGKQISAQKWKSCPDLQNYLKLEPGFPESTEFPAVAGVQVEWRLLLRRLFREGIQGLSRLIKNLKNPKFIR